MSLGEVEMLVFLPIIFAFYWLGPRRRSWQNGILLAASYIFYASWDATLLALLIGGTLIDFSVVRAIVSTSSERTRRRRVLLTSSLALNLGTLAMFKWEGFFATEANYLLSLFGVSASVPVLHVLLPLGLSFYTLQRVGYVLDVYWQRIAATRSLLDFATFVAFFPQMTAGPISRGSELLAQLEAVRNLSARWIFASAAGLLAGVTLSAWVAPTIGNHLVDPVFAQPSTYAASALWLGALFYGLQVFADFAGYSLIAIGVARLFAVELPANFAAPFVSTNLPELWRRWHITLNRWLFDYVFTPLTTSRGWFRGRMDVALLVVFLASGLWHGASWTFVLWGLLHAIGMIVQRNWDEWYRRRCRKNRALVRVRQALWYRALAWVLTIGLFVVALVPFRAPDINAAMVYFAGMAGQNGSQTLDLGPTAALVIGFVVALHLIELPLLARVRTFWASLPAFVKGLAYGAAVALLILATPLTKSAFIYQQF